MVFSLIFCGMLSAVFVLGRGFFLRLYTTDEAVLVFAAQRLLIVTTLELLTSTYEISAGAMRGLGHSLLPAIITCVGSCLLRLVWIATACRLVHDFGLLMIIIRSRGSLREQLCSPLISVSVKNALKALAGFDVCRQVCYNKNW